MGLDDEKIDDPAYRPRVQWRPATGTGAILGLSLGFGVCAALLQPGLGVIVPQLAGRAGVTRANGYLQAATWGGFTVGPLLAGVLTAAGGTGLALGASSSCDSD